MSEVIELSNDHLLQHLEAMYFWCAWRSIHFKVHQHTQGHVMTRNEETCKDESGVQTRSGLKYSVVEVLLLRFAVPLA